MIRYEKTIFAKMLENLTRRYKSENNFAGLIIIY